eukprot:3285817-Rhodomonas_salina.2
MADTLRFLSGSESSTLTWLLVSSDWTELMARRWWGVGASVPPGSVLFRTCAVLNNGFCSDARFEFL